MTRRRPTDTETYPEYVFLRMNVMRLRLEKGLTQTELAQEIKSVDQAYVSALERMQINPTLEVLSKFAKALECTVADLLTEPTDRADIPIE